jgi:hypothetical protein
MTTRSEADELRSEPEDKTGQVQNTTPTETDESRSGLAPHGVMWAESGLYDYDERSGTWGWERFR